MKKEPPIPLRSVSSISPAMRMFGIVVSSLCMAGGVALVVYAVVMAPTDRRIGWYGGWLGGAFGCLIGGLGGLLGTLADSRRRMPAPILFAQLRHDQPTLFYRRVFWPCLALTAVCLVVGALFGHWHLLQGFLQTSAILAFTAGCQEASRRHSTRLARSVFALYADGVLDPADAAAIDDARAKDPKFDAAVREYQQLAARLEALGKSPHDPESPATE